MIFFRISRQTPERSEVCRFSINFAKTKLKITEIQISENFENYSKLFIVSLGNALRAPRQAVLAQGAGAVKAFLATRLPVEAAAGDLCEN